MLLLVSGSWLMALLLTASSDMCVYRCVSTGGVPELHQGAPGKWEQAVYMWNQCLHPHLHQPNGRNNARICPCVNHAALI